MARTKISEFSATAASNTDIDSININEGCPPSSINDAIRELMAQLKDFQTGAVGDSFNGPVGSTTAGTGAFTTLSASGTATLSGLTASTALALDASKNIVSVTNTGTGSNVLATSPTLVTPALGTPSSGVVTNLTGTASININGTVGATTPTTGAFTTLAASSTVTLSGGTANGVAYLNGSKVVTSGSALTFDGTNFVVGGTAVFGKSTIINSLSGTAAAIGISDNATTTMYANNVSSGVSALWSSGALAFGSNNGTFTERMRLDSTGLGIGTTSPSVKLHASTSGAGIQEVEWLNNSQAVGADVGSAMVFTGTSSNNGLARISGAFSGATTADGAYMAFSTRAVTTGALTERLRLDSAGNLGLGVTLSAWGSEYKVVQNGTTSFYNASNYGYSGLLFNAYNDNTNNRYVSTNRAGEYRFDVTTGNHAWFNAPSGTAGNAITFTQAMTLDASGNLLVGLTAVQSDERMNIRMDGNSQSGLIVSDSMSTAGNAVSVRFYRSTSTQVGSITTTLSATAYNTSSDQRLKDNIADADSASTLIDALQVRKFDWKADGSHQRYGFVAQELVTVAPEAVHQPTDTDEMMAVDYSKLVPMLVKEIQSLRKRLADAGI